MHYCCYQPPKRQQDNCFLCFSNILCIIFHLLHYFIITYFCVFLPVRGQGLCFVCLFCLIFRTGTLIRLSVPCTYQCFYRSLAHNLYSVYDCLLAGYLPPHNIFFFKDFLNRICQLKDKNQSLIICLRNEVLDGVMRMVQYYSCFC